MTTLHAAMVLETGRAAIGRPDRAQRKSRNRGVLPFAGLATLAWFGAEALIASRVA